MTETLVTYARRGAIGVLSLNRPGKLNAINQQMVDEINAALDTAEADEKVKVILLRGHGDAFSAGFDVDEQSGLSIREELTRDFDVIMRFWDSPKPTIAAVHKYCLGSALEMAVCCDITIAAEGCRFGTPEVSSGSGIVALVLPWIVGPKASKRLLLTGDTHIRSDEALSMGLVSQVVPLEQLEQTALQIAEKLSKNDTIAVRLTKQAINTSFDIMGLREALLQALEVDIAIESN